MSLSEPPNASGAGSDGSLLRRFRAGEQDAATALYSRYASRLERLAERNTADDLGVRFGSDDVVQSVFRTFFRRVQKGLYDLPNGEDLWRLLLVISLNKIRKLAAHHRAKKRNVGATSVQDATTLERVVSDGGAGLAYESLRSVVREVLDAAPESHRRVVELRIDGWQVEEIAAETGRSRRTVERVLQQFRERLFGLIDASGDDP